MTCKKSFGLKGGRGGSLSGRGGVVRTLVRLTRSSAGSQLTANLRAFYVADRNVPGAPVSCTKLLLSDDYDLCHPAAAADYHFASTSPALVSAVRNVSVPRVNARGLLANLQTSQA